MAADVAGIDADLVDAFFGAAQGQLIVEVNISHQRNMDGLPDGTDGGSGLHIRHSHTDDLTSGRFQRMDLGHGGSHVGRIGIAHGLNGHRGAAAHGHAAHTDLLAHGITYCLLK